MPAPRTRLAYHEGRSLPLALDRRIRSAEDDLALLPMTYAPLASISRAKLRFVCG